MKKKFSFATLLERYALVLVFVLMVVVFTSIVPTFFSWNSLLNTLSAAAPMGIATIGMAIIILQGGTDLSAGASMYFGCITSYLLLEKAPSVPGYLLLAIVAGALVGLLNGLMISRFKVLPFIVTYGTMMMVRGVSLTLSKQKNIIFNNDCAKFISAENVAGVPLVVILFLLLMVAAWFMLNYTPFGRQLYAVGNNPRSAEKLGINIKRIRLAAYTICGALCGLAGILTGAQAGIIGTGMGDGKEFAFISTAVLSGVSLSGGKCKIFPNLLVGILIYTAIETGLVMSNANPYLYQIVRGGLIAFAVIVDCISYKGDLR